MQGGMHCHAMASKQCVMAADAHLHHDEVVRLEGEAPLLEEVQPEVTDMLWLTAGLCSALVEKGILPAAQQVWAQNMPHDRAVSGGIPVRMHSSDLLGFKQTSSILGDAQTGCVPASHTV